MKRLFLVLVVVFLFGAVDARGAIAIDKHAVQDNNASGDSHIVVTLTGTGSGTLITCQWTISRNTSNTYTSIVDNVNAGSYSIAIATHDTGASIGQIVGQSYKENNAGGTVQITATFTQSNAFGAMTCQSWTGVLTSGALDIAATFRDATSTNAACNSMTTTANGDLIISSVQMLTGVAPTAGSGFSVIDSATFSWYYTESRIQTTAGAITANWTNASDGYSCLAASFKAAGGGGGGTPVKHKSTVSSLFVPRMLRRGR